MTDSLLSTIEFKKGPNGDLAYINAKLKLKSDDEIKINVNNGAPSGKSKLYIYLLLIKIEFKFLFVLLFTVSRIDDQMYTLEPLKEHVSLI